MTPQARWISGAPHSFHGAVCYDHGHLFAPICHDPVSRDAGYLEESSSPHLVLAGVHTSPIPKTENLGRTRPLDTSPGHGVALSPSAQGCLLGYPTTGGVMGPGSAEHLATASGWYRLSRGERQSQAETGHTESFHVGQAGDRLERRGLWFAREYEDGHPARRRRSDSALGLCVCDCPDMENSRE